MPFLNDPVVRPANGKNRWLLIEHFQYEDTYFGLFTVLAGAITDGASIPRLLWTFLGSPMIDSRVFRAAVVHDQLYCSNGIIGQLSRKSCDAIFRRALIEAGVSQAKAWLYYSGVRSGGWVGWNRYKRNPHLVRAEAERITWTA